MLEGRSWIEWSVVIEGRMQYDTMTLPEPGMTTMLEPGSYPLVIAGRRHLYELGQFPERLGGISRMGPRCLPLRSAKMVRLSKKDRARK